ncbi:hypothetical protein V103_02760, partial [Staphylococcus aureus 22(2K81-5)]
VGSTLSTGQTRKEHAFMPRKFIDVEKNP